MKTNFTVNSKGIIGLKQLMVTVIIFLGIMLSVQCKKEDSSSIPTPSPQPEAAPTRTLNFSDSVYYNRIMSSTSVLNQFYAVNFNGSNMKGGLSALILAQDSTFFIAPGNYTTVASTVALNQMKLGQCTVSLYDSTLNYELKPGQLISVVKANGKLLIQIDKQIAKNKSQGSTETIYVNANLSY